MVAIKAKNITRRQAHELLGIQPVRSGTFASHLAVALLTELERQQLFEIQAEFWQYWMDGKVSEGQIRLMSVAPLLRLAGYNRSPIRLDVEEDIARIYIQDEDTLITGRFDIVAVSREQLSQKRSPLWILVVESKNSEASESTGIAQMLVYAFDSLTTQEAVWGLVTNGVTYQFHYLQRGTPPTYEIMPVLNFLEDDRAVTLLQVLKAIREW